MATDCLFLCILLLPAPPTPHFVSLERNLCPRPSIWTVATQLEIGERTSTCTSSLGPLEAAPPPRRSAGQRSLTPQPVRALR